MGQLSGANVELARRSNNTQQSPSPQLSSAQGRPHAHAEEVHFSPEAHTNLHDF